MANPVAAAYAAYIQAIQTRPEAMLALQANSKHSKVFLPSFWSQDRFSMLRKSSPSPGYPTIHTLATLKGHGNEADFLGFLHKSVRHRSLTINFEPFRF
jgi:hypothetical protein